MASTLSNKERALMDAYWRAANTCRSARSILRQSAAQAIAHKGSHQTEASRPLGNDARLEFHLRSPEPGIKKNDLDVIYITGPGMVVPAWSRTLISKAPTARSIRISLPMKRE